MDGSVERVGPELNDSGRDEGDSGKRGGTDDVDDELEPPDAGSGIAADRVNSDGDGSDSVDSSKGGGGQAAGSGKRGGTDDVDDELEPPDAGSGIAASCLAGSDNIDDP